MLSGAARALASDSPLEALERVCASSEFRSSQRSQSFLRYVVKATLEDRPEDLKERSIAIQVFGRKPDYNATEDSIVRVQARDVRQRLARYYAAEGKNDPQQITLPIGTYRAEFLTPTPASLDAAPTRRRYTPPLLLAFATLAIIAAAALPRISNSSSAYDRFWQPLTNAARPPIIVSGTARHWDLKDSLQKNLRDNTPTDKPFLAEPGEFIQSDSRMLSFENGSAMLNLVAALSRPNKRVQLRFADQIVSTDLREHPMLFLGAFNNALALAQMPKLRYRFVLVNQKHRIVDSTDPQREWVYDRNETPNGRQSQDYAMLCRLTESSGAVYYIVAGIQGSGTFAAAEFATQPKFWRDFDSQAPSGWENQNVQIVLKTSVVDRVAQAPEIVATHVWR
jgi:hypothetical protein